MTAGVVAKTGLGVILRAPSPAKPYYRVEWYDDRGKRHQRSAGRDRELALAKMVDTDQQLAGVIAPKAHRLVTDLRDTMLAKHHPDKAEGWTPRHYADTKKHLTALLTPYEDWTCQELTRDAVEAMLDTARTDSMRRHYRAALSKMLTWGYGAEWLSKPPALLMPQTTKTAKSSGRASTVHGTSRLYVDAKHIPTANDCKALAEAVLAQPRGGEQGWLMVAVACSSGPRPAELYELRKRDLNLRTNTLRIERQVVHASGVKRQVTPPKWGCTRSTLLPEETVWGEPLADRLAEFVAGKAAGDLLFTAPRGGWLHPSNVNNRWLHAARAAVGGHWVDDPEDPGAVVWVWGSMRHTFATTMLNDGNEIAHVSAAMGHRDPSVTQAIYVNPSVDGLAKMNARSGRRSA